MSIFASEFSYLANVMWPIFYAKDICLPDMWFLFGQVVPLTDVLYTIGINNYMWCIFQDGVS